MITRLDSLKYNLHWVKFKKINCFFLLQGNSPDWSSPLSDSHWSSRSSSETENCFDRVGNVHSLLADSSSSSSALCSWNVWGSFDAWSLILILSAQLTDRLPDPLTSGLRFCELALFSAKRPMCLKSMRLLSETRLVIRWSSWQWEHPMLWSGHWLSNFCTFYWRASPQ